MRPGVSTALSDQKYMDISIDPLRLDKRDLEQRLARMKLDEQQQEEAIPTERRRVNIWDREIRTPYTITLLMLVLIYVVVELLTR